MNTPLVKICGQTDKDIALSCEQAGADFLGFIFYPKSPRNVAVDFAASVEPQSALKVGVFVEQDAKEIYAIMHAAGLDLVQLHGEYDQKACEILGPERVIKVFWPESYNSQEDLVADMEQFGQLANYFLLDSGSSGGGSGQIQNFEMVHNLESPRPWFLAGGLGPDTIEHALEHCSPNGFDLNSGVESSPGVKDTKKVHQALALLKPHKG